MGQSLSNLCGIKPADPPQWAAFEAKMKAEGLSEAAIASFKHNFVTLASGANLMISEAPPRVKPADGHRQSAARAPAPLARSAVHVHLPVPRARGVCARRQRRLAAGWPAWPASAHSASGSAGPPAQRRPYTYYLPYRLITY